MTSAYYFETTTNMTEQELKLTLEKAGIKTTDARRTTLNNDGIIMTETLAKGIWNHETGFNDCNETCKDQTQKHTEWDQLSAEQRDSFSQRLAEFLENSRVEQFSTLESMENDEEFAKVAIERCDR